MNNWRGHKIIFIPLVGEWIYEDLYVILKETQEEINLLEKEKVLENI